MTRRLVVRSAPGRHLLLLACSLGFVALGVLLLVRPDGQPVVGWLMIGFFGTCAATFLWQVADRRPRIVIDERGVFDRTLGIGVVPWSEIAGADVRVIMGSAFIALTLREPLRVIRRLSPLQRLVVRGNRALGFEELNLNLGGLEVSADTMLAWVHRGMAASLAARAQVVQNPPA